MQQESVLHKEQLGNEHASYHCLNGEPLSNLSGAGNNWVERNASRCDIHCSGGYSLLRRCYHLRSPRQQRFHMTLILNPLLSHGIQRSCGNSLRGFRQRHNPDPAYRIQSFPLRPSWSNSIESCLPFLVQDGDWDRASSIPLRWYRLAEGHG